jgi:outer membrane receptor protein involved in Fe transport
MPALRLAIAAALVTAFMQSAAAQAPSTAENSTVTYPADYFSQYQPFSVTDMLNRIPGISVAQGGGPGPQGGPGSSGGSDRRGLGAGGDQVLINGRRIAGKENEGNQQLSRIPASQVQYIEIIRGTSGDLDVRGGSQVINIVLLEAESRSSVAFEFNTDHYHDGKYQPGGKISLTGQDGPFSYFLSAEGEPRWEYRDGFEVSVNADGSLNDTVDRNDTRDSWPVTLVSNLGYELTDQDTVHLNLQWSDGDAPSFTDRVITDYDTAPPVATIERDDIPATNDSWEVGGDYERSFLNGNRFKALFIVNEREDDSTRETFVGLGSSRVKDLYLASYARNRERIIRPSYTMGLTDNQDIEVGLERAQTILDTSLQLGLDIPGTTSPAYGGLVPVTNANGSVEEIRYEYFAIHNWQLNPRMSLETTLLFEDSTISQSGDVSKSRDFNFFRPKVDYRFDITPSVQFRASITKDVAQLSFSDFTASVAGGDDDQNALAGNPDLRQEQSVRYETNLEYRLPNDGGVLNTNLFYHDLTDVIERVDVSTATSILSANGNIGDGERYGINIDGSLRLGAFNLPGILLTSRLSLEESKVTDPFLGIERRLRQQGKGRFSFGYRHDLAIANSMNYGFNYSKNFDGGNFVYDIDKIEEYPQTDQLSLFVEAVGWGDLTYRFETMNTTNAERCRIRSRYVGGTIATGRLNEVENSCSETGIKLAIKIRGTF